MPRAIQDEATQGMTSQDKTSQEIDEVGQGKTRQNRTDQNKKKTEKGVQKKLGQA
jgi:hypothetical protein